MEFDLDRFNSLDSATLEIIDPNGVPTDAKFVFSGPGHKLTRQQAIRLHEARQLQNPKSLSQLEAESVLFIVERLVDWENVKARGEDGNLVEVPFDRGVASELLGDARKGFLFNQCLEFLTSANSFAPKVQK